MPDNDNNLKTILREFPKFMDSLASYFASKYEKEIALTIREYIKRIREKLDSNPNWLNEDGTINLKKKHPHWFDKNGQFRPKMERCPQCNSEIKDKTEKKEFIDPRICLNCGKIWWHCKCGNLKLPKEYIKMEKKLDSEALKGIKELAQKESDFYDEHGYYSFWSVKLKAQRIKEMVLLKHLKDHKKVSEGQRKGIDVEKLFNQFDKANDELIKNLETEKKEVCFMGDCVHLDPNDDDPCMDDEAQRGVRGKCREFKKASRGDLITIEEAIKQGKIVEKIPEPCPICFGDKLDDLNQIEDENKRYHAIQDFINELLSSRGEKSHIGNFSGIEKSKIADDSKPHETSRSD